MNTGVDAAFDMAAGSGTLRRLRNLHTGVKIAAAFVYIVTVMSFDRHEVGRLTPFLLHPVAIGALGAIPLSASVRRLLPALPFCVFAGVSNLLFERETAFVIHGVAVTYGVLSCFSLVFRAALCVEALILLTATTPASAVTAQFRRSGPPSFLPMLFEMTCRYIGVLAAEARSLRIAYTLRGGSQRGVDIRHIGGFTGSLFLRAMARAENIGNALKLRGYGDALSSTAKTAPAAAQPPFVLRRAAAPAAFLCAVCFSCALFRFVDMPLFIGNLWYGLFR
ncbi:MAG: energy-coupling factor transporter transmembrane protein EcfT [Treponema sp.]|jgi:cobalt/nickel transport system permease protein|nr:energy-coupling factor transporter transmembrane protein EcfT [Treponema sp.]